MNNETVKSICFYCGNYPTENDPRGAFVRPLVCAMADRGIKCTVIALQGLSSVSKGHKIRKTKWMDVTENGNQITVYQPVVATLSEKVQAVSSALARMAIQRLWKREHLSPDVIYTYFWHEAVMAAMTTSNIPIIVQSSESEIRVHKLYSDALIKQAQEKIKGVVAVAGKCLTESKNLGLIRPEMQTIVIPNAIDNTSFYVKNKSETRRKMNIPDSDIVACFVGAFIERKGPNRVIKAAEQVDGIKLIMIGSGGELLTSDKIIHQGPVSHEKIADFLNASDMFVLPTLNEGCCNAIIEALACGLPVISSNLSFNDEILDDDCAIRITPSDVDELAEAIRTLFLNEAKRKTMSQYAIQKAESLTIEKRTDSMIDFMEKVVSKNGK